MAPRLTAALLSVATLAACGGQDPAAPSPTLPPRAFLMGFSALPARPELDLALRTIDLWARRADAALVLVDPPWAELLAGNDPEALVRQNPLGIADYFRGKGLRIVASIDPTNGLDRGSEAAALVAAGRSLAEPAVREFYTRYVGAFVTVVRPEAITLASETNLVRAIAPRRVYAGVVAAANEAAAAARLRDPGLARAEAWFQITFTDLDVAAFPFGQGLLPFAFLGLVDVNLQPKPALQAWDATFARPLQRP